MEQQIIINSIAEDRYPLLWAGLFGAEIVFSNHDYPNSIMEFLLADYQNEVPDNFWKYHHAAGSLQFNILLNSNNYITISAWVHTDVSFPAEIIEIGEWSVVNNQEAKITFQLKNKIGITALAVDYFDKKSIYANSTMIQKQILVSGIAARIDDPYENGFKASGCGYEPKDYAEVRSPFFKFHGIVLSIQEVVLSEINIEGLILDVRLLQLDEAENFFVVKMFVNKLNNFTTKRLKVGERIAGIVMFQAKFSE